MRSARRGRSPCTVRAAGKPAFSACCRTSPRLASTRRWSPRWRTYAAIRGHAIASRSAYARRGTTSSRSTSLASSMRPMIALASSSRSAMMVAAPGRRGPRRRRGTSAPAATRHSASGSGAAQPGEDAPAQRADAHRELRDALQHHRPVAPERVQRLLHDSRWLPPAPSPATPRPGARAPTGAPSRGLRQAGSRRARPPVRVPAGHRRRRPPPPRRPSRPRRPAARA